MRTEITSGMQSHHNVDPWYVHVPKDLSTSSADTSQCKPKPANAPARIRHVRTIHESIHANAMTDR